MSKKKIEITKKGIIDRYKVTEESNITKPKSGFYDEGFWEEYDKRNSIDNSDKKPNHFGFGFFDTFYQKTPYMHNFTHFVFENISVDTKLIAAIKSN